jgi:N-glycosylase/DNA lyase
MTPGTRRPLRDRVLDAIRAVCTEVRDTGSDPGFWMQLPERELWRELVAGILGSRVRYEVALSAVDALDHQGLLEPLGERCRKPEVFETDLEKLLSGNLSKDSSQMVMRRYPFPRQRAKRIRRAHEQIYGKGQTLKQMLGSASCAWSARRHFVDDVPGIGPKQASMFLRNIGFAGRFAVLDVHVLSYMELARLPVNRLSVSLIRGYEVAERVLMRHVEKLGLCPRKFDIALWVVVRVLKRDFKVCLW